MSAFLAEYAGGLQEPRAGTPGTAEDQVSYASDKKKCSAPERYNERLTTLISFISL